VATLAAALALSVLLGWWFGAAEHYPAWHGMFCAAGNAVTAGGDCAVRGRGYLIVFIEFATIVPMYAGAMSFFTSWLVSGHFRRAETASQARADEHRQIVLDTYRAITGDHHPLASPEGGD